MRYIIYATVSTPGTDVNGNPITISANTVLNAILWDEKSHYDPGIDIVMVQSDILQIGDVVTPKV